MDDPFRQSAAPDGLGAALARRQPLSDQEIRSVLHGALKRRPSDACGCAIADEVPLGGGYVRADVVTFSPNALHVFEIKGDRDHLHRLDEQARSYSEVADRVTLVVGWKLAAEALRRIPYWWGVWLAERESEEHAVLVPLREGEQNQMCRAIARAELLSRAEALALLTDLGASAGVKSKSRDAVIAKVAAAVSADEVRRALWRKWSNYSTNIRADVRTTRFPDLQPIT